MIHSSDSPQEVFEAAKDAIEVGAFKMARIFIARMREIAHEVSSDKEIIEISRMMADIRARME